MRISDWSSDVCSSDLIDGTHRRSVWICPIGKRLGAAIPTKPMIDFVRVEHIRAQRLLALCQCELLCWKEGQQKSFSSAVRAIATDRLGRQLSVHFELNSSAVTASFKHWGSLYKKLYRTTEL